MEDNYCLLLHMGNTSDVLIHWGRYIQGEQLDRRAFKRHTWYAGWFKRRGSGYYSSLLQCICCQICRVAASGCMLSKGHNRYRVSFIVLQCTTGVAIKPNTLNFPR